MLEQGRQLGADENQEATFGHWIFRLLASMEVQLAVRRALMALYTGIVTTMRFRGMPVDKFGFASRIKQGCPLSAFSFALSLDPLALRILVGPIFTAARLCAFAGDLAIATALYEQRMKAAQHRPGLILPLPYQTMVPIGVANGAPFREGIHALPAKRQPLAQASPMLVGATQLPPTTRRARREGPWHIRRPVQLCRTERRRPKRKHRC